MIFEILSSYKLASVTITDVIHCSMDKEVIIYQNKSGAIAVLKGDFQKETLWASLDQIAKLFGRDKSVISRHIKNIFKEGELNEKSVVAFFATTAADGKTYQVAHYDLDMIISVGYRVNSVAATKFRQWTTKVLHQHIVKGYTVDKERLTANYAAFSRAIEDVKKLATENSALHADDIIELIKTFASTWFSLDAYDKSSLPKKGASKKQVDITAADLHVAIAELKRELVTKKEATDFFAHENSKDALAGIVGNVFQSFGGADLYPTLEEKAAHLLYFIIKNHPFTDGNKRSGAFAFIWYLKKSGLLDRSRFTPEALTAITLLIAESNPKEKERMTGLILLLLQKH